VLSLAGCVTAKPSEKKHHGPIEVLAPTEPVTLDPRFATRALDVRLTRLIHEGLVRLDPETLLPRPNLAQGIDRDAEGRLVITLRPNQRFHSGKSLSAEDVCATLSALSSPHLSSPHRNIVETFVNCRVRDALTLTVEMAFPRASYMTDLEIPILRADEAAMPERPDGQLDGLGPYRVSNKTHSSVTLVPARSRAEHGPNFPLLIRTVQDENVRAMRILSGKAEVAPNAFSPTLLAGFRNESVKVASRPGANVTYLLVNGDLTPFNRSAIRKALSQAIDRKLITKELLSSFAQPAKWLLPEGHWAAPKDLPNLDYQPTAAKPIFIGLPRTVLLTSTDRSRLLQARAIAQMLTEAGLQTDVTPLELGLLLSRLDAGQFSLAILQIPELTEPNILRWFFHPRGISNPSEGRNRARYRSPIAAQLLDLGSTEMSRPARQKDYFELAHVMLEDMPVIPLWHEDQVVVTRDRAKEFLPSAEGRWAALAAL
jgi:peptide/nickel transport system substrate-binding protein